MTPKKNECCAALVEGGGSETPIACTLNAGEFAERTASIRALSEKWLRGVDRTPLALTLAYDRGATQPLHELVAKEQRCCAFLTFAITETEEEIVLRIVTLVDAAAAAAVVFDEFCGGLSDVAFPPTRD